MTHSSRFPGARRQLQGIHDRISEELNSNLDDGKLPEGWYESTWSPEAVPHLARALNAAKNALMAHDLGQPDLPSVDEAISHFGRAVDVSGEAKLSSGPEWVERNGHWDGQPHLEGIAGKFKALHYHRSRYATAITGRPTSPEHEKLGRQFDEIIRKNYNPYGLNGID
jgi:hypothetical protein